MEERRKGLAPGAVRVLLCAIGGLALVTLGVLASRVPLMDYFESRAERIAIAIASEHARAVHHVVADHAVSDRSIQAHYAGHDPTAHLAVKDGSGLLAFRIEGDRTVVVAATPRFADWVGTAAPGSPAQAIASIAEPEAPLVWKGRDAEGRRYLAAAQLLATPGWGVALVMDLDAVAAPFSRSASVAAGALIAAMLLAAIGFLFAQRAAASSRRLMHQVLSLGDQALLVVAADGSVLRTNDRAAELFALDQSGEPPGLDQLLRLPAAGRVSGPGSGFAPFLERLRRFEGWGLLGEGVRGRRLDGAEFPALLSIGQDDQEGTSLVVVRDVTREVGAHEALAASEERHRDLLAQTPAMLAILTLDERIVYMNPEWSKGLEIGPDQIGEPLAECFGEKDRRALGAAIASAASDRTDECLAGFCTGSGRALDLHFRFQPYRQDGSTSHVLCSATDLTPLVRAQRELDRTREEQARLLTAINSILVSLDVEGRIRLWNDQAAETFGIPAEQAIGRVFMELPIVWSTDAMGVEIERARGEDAQVLLDDVAYRRPDGDEAVLGLSVDWSGSGDEERCLILGTDVTARRHLERQLAHSQKLESIGQLAAGVAHEINTPIQYVGDNIRFLADGVRDLHGVFRSQARVLEACAGGGQPATELLDEAEKAAHSADLDFLWEELPRALEQAGEGVQRVSRIVTAMKVFSHPGEEEKTLADLNECIRSTVTVATNEWKYVAELELDLADGLPAVPCDVGGFNQVILNVLVNAAHAIADKIGDTGGKGRIGITTRRVGDAVEVAISDSGCGIPEAVRDRVMDPFFTTKGVGRGTGQGLSIAHGVIVEQHAGSIGIESEEGEGTTITLRLPVTPEVEEESESDESEGVIG